MTSLTHTHTHGKNNSNEVDPPRQRAVCEHVHVALKMQTCLDIRLHFSWHLTQLCTQNQRSAQHTQAPGEGTRSTSGFLDLLNEMYTNASPACVSPGRPQASESFTPFKLSVLLDSAVSGCVPVQSLQQQQDDDDDDDNDPVRVKHSLSVHID